MADYIFYKEIDLRSDNEDRITEEEVVYTCQPSGHPELGKSRDSLQQAFREWAADFKPYDNVVTIPEAKVFLMIPQHSRLRLPLSSQEMKEVAMETLRALEGK